MFQVPKVLVERALTGESSEAAVASEVVEGFRSVDNDASSTTSVVVRVVFRDPIDVGGLGPAYSRRT